MKANSELIQSNKVAKNSLIVFTHGGGRFGNQMFSYAQLLAFSLEHDNIDFVNMACWEYADLLELGRQNAICSRSLKAQSQTDARQIAELSSRKHIFYQVLCFCCTKLYIKNDSVAKNIIICLLYFFGGNSFAKYYSVQSIYIGEPWVNEKLLIAQRLQSLDLADAESLALINKTDTTILAGWGICDWNLVTTQAEGMEAENHH